MELIESASPHTLRAYSLDLKQALGVDLKPQNRGLDPETFTHEKANWVPELKTMARDASLRWSKLKPASRNRKIATLKSYFGWLHREGLIEKDLALQLQSPRVPQRLPKHLSVDEAIALVKTVSAAASADAATPRDRAVCALVLLLYGAGLRVSEATQVSWANVDLSTRTIRVLGKGNKERIVSVPKIAAEALLSLKKDTGRDRFIFGETALSTRVAYTMVREAGAKAMIARKVHPHVLRHSFATHLLRSGANLRTLQELLGHSTLQATSRYTHVGIDQLARTMESHHPLSRSGTAGSGTAKKKLP